MRQVGMLQSKLAAEKELSARAHELEMKAVGAENEKTLREAENQQLRSLMGNVAHDLKTPLFSFDADVEALKSFFLEMPKEFVSWVNQSMKKRLGFDFFEPIEPIGIFDSLQATSRFMAMAINRSQGAERPVVVPFLPPAFSNRCHSPLLHAPAPPPPPVPFLHQPHPPTHAHTSVPSAQTT